MGDVSLDTAAPRRFVAVPGGEGKLPLMFSLLARKAAG